MTYKESYEKCQTLEELKRRVATDLCIAEFICSRDRIQVIKDAALSVCEERGWHDEDENNINYNIEALAKAGVAINRDCLWRSISQAMEDK